MKIMLRDRENKKWQKLEPRGYDNEAQLEALLEESPDLLPTEDRKPVLFFKRQVTLGQNAVDLLGLDADGNIVVVECKLESSREARRMVVAQILEYAAQLWGMSFEEFEGLLTSESQPSLVELVRNRADQDWSADGFSAAVERTLERGDFRLVIAINGVTPELKRILEYANSRGNFKLEALELRQFSDGNNEVLVPQIHGPALPRPTTAGQRGPRRSLDEVYQAAASPEAGRRLKKFVEGWIAAGHEAVPGTSGISFRAHIQGDSVSAIVLLAPNVFSFHRAHYEYHGIPKDIVDDFFKSLGSLPCADQRAFAIQSGPRIYVDRMSEDDVQRLLEIGLRLVRRWQESLTQ